MDELDLIRRFAEEDGEPAADARERVGARVEWGIEARAAEKRAPDPALRAVRRNRLRRLTVAAAAAALLVVAASLGVAQLLRPGQAEAVQFSRSNDYIVAMVTDPFAAQDRLRAAFAAHGLDIDLKLVPVSPSIVGSVVYLDGNGIETLLGTRYDGPKGEQPVGLRIPTDFKGHAQIVLGRPAKPGETYTSAGEAFAPGEALHGVDLVGMKVADAVGLLDGMGLSVSWRVDVPADSPEAKAAAAKAAAAKPSETLSATPTATSQPSPTPTATSGSTEPAPEAGAGGTAMYSLVVGPDGIAKYGDYYVTGAVPKAEGSVYVFAAAEAPQSQAPQTK